MMKLQQTALFLLRMKYKFLIIIISLITFISCKKYKDPDPFTDPRIVNKYCNTPSAINYNWNFPGIPDSTTCIFPAQIYHGNYFYRDSTFNNAGLFLDEDSFNLTFIQVDTTRLRIVGFCSTDTIRATANRFYKFTIDSVAKYGQLLCSPTDTISGKGSKFDLSDTTTIKLIYQVATDTGIIYHSGTATKL
jgi:hypothetical protein